MANGSRVAATRTGGNLQDGEIVLFVPPENSIALVDALRHFVVNPGAQYVAELDARERAALRYSIAGMIGRYQGVYQHERRGGA
ncbi:MAG: hypothetical protein RIE06_27920 [Roseibium album]|uniref:glycosyltransferase n=1 Tax=Roseibium album TaxID=311410 RepID=UPI0032EDC53D